MAAVIGSKTDKVTCGEGLCVVYPSNGALEYFEQASNASFNQYRSVRSLITPTQLCVGKLMRMFACMHTKFGQSIVELTVVAS